MIKRTYYEVEIKDIANGEVRKAAFAKGINRVVNYADAKKIAGSIEERGYFPAEIIQVIPAEVAITKRNVQLVDINHNKISSEKANEYNLVVDGQHRVYATAICNKKRGTKPAIQIPAIIVELRAGDSIADYISAINVTKNEWKPIDYLRGASNVIENPLLKRYMDLAKQDGNPDGMSLSTLNIIFCQNAKAISKHDYTLLCQGKIEKGIRNKKSIIPSFSLEKGDEFIDLCLNLGFSKADISHRYVAEQFNNLRIEHDFNEAMRIFRTITPDDITAMHNDKGKIIEYQVKEQFEIIKSRIEG